MHAYNISFKMITYREQQELQFLGFFGIFKESFKLIFSRKKIFTQITLTLILPFCIAAFVQLKVFQLIANGTKRYNKKLDHMDMNTFKYAKFMVVVSTETSAYSLLIIVYFAFGITLNLLSTSSVTYTIACIYTAKEITFRKIITISPKVWIRDFITFMYSFAIFFVYITVPGILLLGLAWFLLTTGTRKIMLAIFLPLVIVYVIGIIYMSLLYRLASVVSVLEDYEFQAIIKSYALMKGKIEVFVGFFILRKLFFIATEVVPLINNKFLSEIVRNSGIQILCWWFQFLLDVFVYVAYYVIYFVCKSYHHETIDRNSLADHLDGLLGKPKDIVPTGGDSFEAHVV